MAHLDFCLRLYLLDHCILPVRLHEFVAESGRILCGESQPVAYHCQRCDHGCKLARDHISSSLARMDAFLLRLRRLLVLDTLYGHLEHPCGLEVLCLVSKGILFPLDTSLTCTLF